MPIQKILKVKWDTIFEYLNALWNCSFVFIYQPYQIIKYILLRAAWNSTITLTLPYLQLFDRGLKRFFVRFFFFSSVLMNPSFFSQSDNRSHIYCRSDISVNSLRILMEFFFYLSFAKALIEFKKKNFEFIYSEKATKFCEIFSLLLTDTT